MNTPSTGVTASRWFGIRAEYEYVSPWRKFAVALRQFFVGLASLGLTLIEYNPKRWCNVIVYDRLDGRPVQVFAHSHLGPADSHAVNLLERARTMDVVDFCRELRIAPEKVLGDGLEPPQQHLIDWVEVKPDGSRTSRTH